MDYEAAYKIEHKAVDDIWKLVDPFATKDIDITVRTQGIVEMVAKLKAENERLTRLNANLTNTHNAMVIQGARDAETIQELLTLLDPPVCRLQFPDGHVPGNAVEAAEGWKRWADTFRAERHALAHQLQELGHQP